MPYFDIFQGGKMLSTAFLGQGKYTAIAKNGSNLKNLKFLMGHYTTFYFNTDDDPK